MIKLTPSLIAVQDDWSLRHWSSVWCAGARHCQREAETLTFLLARLVWFPQYPQMKGSTHLKTMPCKALTPGHLCFSACVVVALPFPHFPLWAGETLKKTKQGKVEINLLDLLAHWKKIDAFDKPPFGELVMVRYCFGIRQKSMKKACLSCCCLHLWNKYSTF